MDGGQNRKLYSVYVNISNSELIETMKSEMESSTIMFYCGGCSNRIEAMEEVKILKPDVIITDAYMPFMDILTFIRNVEDKDESQEKHRYKPVVYALVSSENTNIIEHLLENGIRHCILLPSSTANMINSVERDLMMEDNILETKIVGIFKELGLSVQSSGYKYLKYMIMVCYRDLENLNCVGRDLYPVMGEKYNTSPASVERSMRVVIENAWKVKNDKAWKKYFESTYKPTVKEFVAELVNTLKF